MKKPRILRLPKIIRDRLSRFITPKRHLPDRKREPTNPKQAKVENQKRGDITKI